MSTEFFVEFETPSFVGEWQHHGDFEAADLAHNAADILARRLESIHGLGEVSVRVNRRGSFEVRRREGSGWIGVGDFDSEEEAKMEAARISVDERIESDVVETDIGQIFWYPVVETEEEEPEAV